MHDPHWTFANYNETVGIQIVSNAKAALLSASTKLFWNRFRT